MYEKVKRYYELGLWNEERVKNAVKMGVISEGEYEEIVGKECKPPHAIRCALR